MKQKQADITLKENTFFISGELDCSNVMSLYKKSLQQFNESSELRFDFSQLKTSDSTGLALIIEWIKFAKTRNKPVQFIHLSPELMLIAKAAGVDGLIVGLSSL